MKSSSEIRTDCFRVQYVWDKEKKHKIIISMKKCNVCKNYKLLKGRMTLVEL